MRIAFDGAGFASCVLANKLAKTGNFQIQVVDERPHLGGNYFKKRVEQTGILIPCVIKWGQYRCVFTPFSF